MAKLPYCHAIGASDSLATRVQGAVAFLTVSVLMYVLGPLSPLLFVGSCLLLPWYLTFLFLAALVFPFVAPIESLYSPAFCRFALSMAGWLKGGSSIWTTEEVYKDIGGGTARVNHDLMVCYHPHGMIPCGFLLNGAIRGRSKDPSLQPPWCPLDWRVSGIQAPVLFTIPILRWVLLAFGCCVPATKKGMHKLLRDRTTFGIIPGGSEEVAIHQAGAENIYLLKRAGFIKYALQYGTTLVIAFTFGESDLYSSVGLVRSFNLWLVKRFGFVLPIFAGHWLFPLLPRSDVALNTVLGKVLKLPRIAEPTSEEVTKWQKIYIAELEALFEEHKEQFGYSDRKLKFF